MFNTFSKQKIVLIGVALLIVGAGVLIMSRSGFSGGGFGLIAQAWQATFGSFGSVEVAVGVPLPSGSTMTESAVWPSLLIDKKAVPKPSAAAGAPKVSAALRSAVSNAVAAAGLASSSLQANGSEPQIPLAASPQWCDFNSTAQGDPGIIFNEVAWMGSSQGPNDERIVPQKTQGSTPYLLTLP